jgi:hypothetical protein
MITITTKHIIIINIQTYYLSKIIISTNISKIISKTKIIISNTSKMISKMMSKMMSKILNIMIKMAKMMSKMKVIKNIKYRISNKIR